MVRNPSAIPGDKGQIAARAALIARSRAGVDDAMAACAVPVDASVLALAVAIHRGHRRPAQLASDEDARLLAAAVLALAHAVTSAWLTDRSAPYAPGEPDRFGHVPPAGDAWITPREIAASALPHLAELPRVIPPQPEQKGR